MVENCENRETNSLTTAYWGYIYNNDIRRKINVVVTWAIFCVTMVVLVLGVVIAIIILEIYIVMHY